MENTLYIYIYIIRGHCSAFDDYFLSLFDWIQDEVDLRLEMEARMVRVDEQQDFPIHHNEFDKRYSMY